MTIEVRVPQLPESVADATLVSWHKKPGDAVARDENLVDLETDKVVLEVPAAAAVYYNDMYVDRELSMQTAQAIRGLQAWVTSEYEHDGLRVSNGAVLDRLIGMVRGNI